MDERRTLSGIYSSVIVQLLILYWIRFLTKFIYLSRSYFSLKGYEFVRTNLKYPIPCKTTLYKWASKLDIDGGLPVKDSATQKEIEPLNRTLKRSGRGKINIEFHHRIVSLITWI